MFVDEKAAGEKQPVKVGYLRLSEAIRIGSKLRPKCTGAFFSEGGSCAMGAAMEAYGLPYDTRPYSAAEKAAPLFPMLFENSTKFTRLATEIYMRNDWPDATREEVADWLESQGY